MDWLRVKFRADQMIGRLSRRLGKKVDENEIWLLYAI